MHDELAEDIHTVSRILGILRKYIRRHDPKEEPTDRSETLRVMIIMQSRNLELYEISLIMLKMTGSPHLRKH